MMKPASIDGDYLLRVLLRLLSIHSPAGYTDPVVRAVCDELEQLGIEFELTRRGAIRATLPGKTSCTDRAIVGHVDTLGAMVKTIKDNGRLSIVPIGTWSARFAEGARVSIFTDSALYRGTILPLKASGHIYNDEIDTQPVSWENLEVRIDSRAASREATLELGIRTGDFIGVDSCAEIVDDGFINARHLDNKAGVAAMLAAMKALAEAQTPLPVECHMLFTISEETGSGASAVLHGDVAEMVSVDNGTCGHGQESFEHGVTIAMGDSTGPFDYHLTRRLITLCRDQGLPHRRDVFRYYRCDSASAVEAGNDIRTALITFGVDASHGYERTHREALEHTARLIALYAQTPLIFSSQPALGPLEAFPITRIVEVDVVKEP